MVIIPAAYPRSVPLRPQELTEALRRLWIEHVLWTRFFIVSTAFSLPDLSFVTSRLLQNPGDFGNVLRRFYGPKITEEFVRLLTDHLVIAAALVSAAKAGNTPEAERQRALWYQNAEQIARFLAGINPFWCEAQWRALLFEHLRLTEEEAVQILTGQYEQSIRQYDLIQAEALVMADVMARGILQQFCLC